MKNLQLQCVTTSPKLTFMKKTWCGYLYFIVNSILDYTTEMFKHVIMQLHSQTYVINTISTWNIYNIRPFKSMCLKLSQHKTWFCSIIWHLLFQSLIKSLWQHPCATTKPRFSCVNDDSLPGKMTCSPELILNVAWDFCLRQAGSNSLADCKR